MKKNTKSMLISALILFVAGFLLTIITLIYTSITKIDIYPGQNNSKPDIGNVTKTFEEMGAVPGVVIKKIELTSYVGSVNVVSTEGQSRIALENTDLNNLEYFFGDGLLSVGEKNPVGFLGVEVSKNGFSFNGLRQIFRWSNNARTERNITLYINPADFDLVLNVTGFVGDIKVRDISCSELYIKNSVGSIMIDGCSMSSVLNVKSDDGDVYLRRCSYPQATVDLTLGDIFALIGSNKTNLKTVKGDILVLTQLSDEDYQLRLSTTLGGISPFSYENDKKEYSLYSAENNSLWCQSVVGSVRLREFDSEKYPETDFEVFGDLLKLP
ncbi:MAG: DUF4097 family beta strand repeat protein [Clostridia bacterium]|nr:DUF4097 family beta strand repeat protein [Clostridia bacterium]